MKPITWGGVEGGRTDRQVNSQLQHRAISLIYAWGWGWMEIVGVIFSTWHSLIFVQHLLRSPSSRGWGGYQWGRKPARLSCLLQHGPELCRTGPNSQATPAEEKPCNPHSLEDGVSTISRVPNHLPKGLSKCAIQPPRGYSMSTLFIS